MRKHRIWAWAAAAALVAPVAAVAQVEAVREQRFRELDKNGDGVISRDEYDGHPGNFRAMDANGDGVLSHDEFVHRYREGNETAPPVKAAPAAPPVVTSTAPVTPPVPDAFATMDRNGDGVITRSEWRADLAPGSFARLDRNHDGLVTRDEFANPLPMDSAEARFGDLDRNNNGYISRGEWRGERLSFDTVDRNGDNRITIDEYLSMAAGVYGQGYGTGSRSRFAQLDRNHDGVINRSEWRGEPLSFDDVDRDGDNRITLDEYVNQPADGYGYGSGNRTGTSRMEERFAQMDRNRDGVLSRSEWRDSASFRQVDRNGDGVVTLREYLNAPVVYEQPYGDDSSYSYSRSTPFRDLDRNGNGYIDRSEWPYDRAEFDRLDRDGDGRLTRDEYPGPQGRTRDAYGEFQRLDANGDGVISRREWNGSARSFADYDRNGDGVISRDEFVDH